MNEVQERNLIQIQKKWVSLLTAVLAGLKLLSIDIQQVRVVICNFPASRVHTNILLFQEHLAELRSVKSLDALFELLGEYEYWSWNHPHLLEAIVHALGTAELRQLVKCYQKELEAFRINVKLSKYIELVRKDESQSRPQKPDFVSMIVKLGARWSEYMLQCVEEFWMSVVEEFSLAPYALVFHEAKPGCVSLTFLLPASITPSMILESKTKLQFFKNQNITSLIIDGHRVYNMSVAELAMQQTTVVTVSNKQIILGLHVTEPSYTTLHSNKIAEQGHWPWCLPLLLT